MELTIITVVKNNLAGLRRTHESLLSQRNQEFQWLVSDGQSTDGTQEWLASLGTRGPRFTSEPDRSLFDAMNRSLGRLETEYCIFLNGGDYFWDAQVTDQIIHAIQSQRFLVGYGKYVLGSAPGFGQRERGRHITTRLDMFRGPVPCHQTMVISRKAFQENGPYREDLGIYGDVEWVLRYSKKRHPREFVYLPFVVAFYDAQGVSYNRFFQHARVYLRVLRETGSSLEQLAGVLGWLQTATYVALSSAHRSLKR